MKNVDNQITVYQILSYARSMALDVIKSFDGKVLNKRLEKAVETKIRDYNVHLHANLVISYDYNIKNNDARLDIRFSNCGGFYGLENETSLYIPLSPLEDGNRVVWEKMLERAENKDYLTERIESHQKAKKEYGKVLRQAQKIRDMIEDYGKNTNSCVRNFLTNERIIDNKFYL